MLDTIDMEAEVGTLFGGCSVPGTPITAAITTALSETAAFALLRNTDTRLVSEGGKIVIPKYLRLICRTAPASATSLQLAIAMDDIDRYSSGGSQIALASSRSDQLDNVAFPPKARLDVGALVLNANATRRKWITIDILKNAIPVVGDEFVITFGRVDATSFPQLLTGAAAQVFLHATDTVALIPGGAKTSQGGITLGAASLAFHLWAPGNLTTAGVYDVEYGGIEKS